MIRRIRFRPGPFAPPVAAASSRKPRQADAGTGRNCTACSIISAVGAAPKWRLYNVSAPTVSRIVSAHRTELTRTHLGPRDRISRQVATQEEL